MFPRKDLASNFLWNAQKKNLVKFVKAWQISRVAIVYLYFQTVYEFTMAVHIICKFRTQSS